MIKKTIVCATAFAFLAGFAVPAISSDAGPESITLESTIDVAAKPKPAVFPHKKHQDAGLACGECHHGAADGKQVPYVDGDAVAKCESCHNKAAGLGPKTSSFKDVAHTNCKGCHKEKGVDNKCATCHP